MRKLLSVILAISMVLSSVVFAVPFAFTAVDTNGEFAGEVGAELMANKNLARGINLFTGTKDAFDGDNYSDYSSWLKEGTKGLLELAAVTDDPTGTRDKVLNLTLPAKCSSGYPNFWFDFGGDLDTDIGHSYVYLAFDYQKYVSDMSGYTQNDAFWMLNTHATSGDFAPINSALAANDGWVHYGKVMDLSVNSTGSYICSSDNPYYDNQDINKKLVVQFGVNTDNTVPVNILFDNLVLAPAYKVTYYNKAGTEVVNEEFVVVDEEGNILSSFTPETLLSGGKAYGNWALSKGGASVTEVALTGKDDIALYATTEADVFGTAKVVLDKKLTKKGDKAVATAVFTTDVNFDPAKVTWTVADKNVAIVNYDADKSLATVTAMGAGTTEITFDYNGTSFTDTITVADGPVVASNVTSGNAISTFAGLDLDVYEYITFNVTNTSGSDKVLSVSLNDEDAGSDIGINLSSYDVTVPAGVANYDVYLDLSDESAWTESAKSIVATVDGVVINNAKLWAELNVENGIEIEADKNLLTVAGSSIEALVYCSSDLEGVYGEEYTITVDADPSVAKYEIDGTKVTVTAVAGNGVVTISAVSNEDASVSATKEVLVNVIEGKNIALMWDFNDASNTGFSFAQRYTASEFTGTTANVVAAKAVFPGTTEAVPVELSKGIVDGKNVTIVKTYENLYGTMSTGSVPSGVSVAEHPYLVIKARSSYANSHKLGIYMAYGKYGYDEKDRKITADVALTPEWKYYVIDASVSAANGHGENFSGMMFSINSDSVISSEIKKSGSTYYIEGDVEFDPYNNIEIDEMYFANYDPTKINYGVSLKADKTSLDGDGLITLYPEVFADDVVANDGVDYFVDKDGYVSIFKNSDGTATVTPLRDGTVTITASSVMDETAKASVTLNLSNIPTRTVAYDLKLMLIGNSYLEHAYLATADKDLYNGYLNKNDIPRGMAATSPELDYYARLCYYLTEGFEGSFVSKKQGGAVIEQAWKQGLADNKPANLVGWDRDKSLTAMKGAWEGILDYMDREQPNLITIQLAENAAHAYEESAEWFYRELYTVIDEHRPENSVVVIISPMGTGPASKVQARIASEYGFYWADNTWIGDDYGWSASNPYLAFQHYPDYTNAHVVEFRSHPGNLGMDEIAKSAYAIFKDQIPTTIPANLVTVPTSVEITGKNTITTEGGTAKLYANVTPSSATPSMIWTVDNENLATVDETGLVTAKLNGKVTVTATSVYDENVKDTYEITITGQAQHYTITYAAGTKDTVTGLPESYDYAAGNYEFPELVAPPERNGYKFLGWALTAGGEVVESVEMTGATTVYATWQFADSWTFDNDGDLEGIMVAGFNTAVKDGKMSTISYDGISVGFSDETLLIPAGMYKKFKANISMSTVDDGDFFTLTIITDNGKKTYTKATLVGANDYEFDISDATGMITGFTLFTSNDADGVGMTVDSIAFEKSEITSDTVLDSYDVVADTNLDANGNKVTINNLNVAENATITLGVGTYVIGDITGGGSVKASPNANVIVTGDVKPAGYVEINIGKKTEGAVRYAQVEGYTYLINEEVSNNKYGIILEGSDNLVAIIEKTEEGTDTSYYHVYSEKDVFDQNYYAPGLLNNYMYNSEELSSMRAPDAKTKNMPGVRFAATVSTAAKNHYRDFGINEYGFIVGLKDQFDANSEQLNFKATKSKYVTGVAFKDREFDKVFDRSNDSAHVFTGVLYNIPEVHYKTKLVARTYTKVTIIGGGEYTIYGEEMVASLYDMAVALKNEGGLSQDVQALVDNIINTADELDKDLNLPGDSLYD